MEFKEKKLKRAKIVLKNHKKMLSHKTRALTKSECAKLFARGERELVEGPLGEVRRLARVNRLSFEEAR